MPGYHGWQRAGSAGGAEAGHVRPTGAAVGAHGLGGGPLAQGTQRASGGGAQGQPCPGVCPGEGLAAPATQGASLGRLVARSPPVSLRGHIQTERLSRRLDVWGAECVVLGDQRGSRLSASLHGLPVGGVCRSLLGCGSTGMGKGGVPGVEVAPVSGHCQGSFPGPGERGPCWGCPPRCPWERAVAHGDVVVGVALGSFTPVKHSQNGGGLLELSCTAHQEEC